MRFYYIDDVIDDFLRQIEGKANPDADGIYRLPEEKIYHITLGELADTFYGFRACQKDGTVPDRSTDLKEKLYVTYQSYAK